MVRRAAMLLCVALVAAAAAPTQARRPAGLSDDGRLTQPATSQAVTVDVAAGTIIIPARAARQGTQSVLEGAIEYALVCAGGKAYETLFVTDCGPREIREAFTALGCRGGLPAGESTAAVGQPFEVQVEYASPDGKPATRPMDEFILRRPSLKPLRKEHWVYTGSCEAIDPTTGGKTNQACLTLAIIGLHYTDGSPLIQNSRDDARNENIYVADEKALPEANTPVKLVIRRVAAKVPDGTQRLAVTVSGQVGGVGYAQFAQCQARLRGLRGMAQESGDDRCEIELEGKQAAIDEVVAELKAGPRGAKVKSVATTQIAPQGGPDQFNIR